MDHTRRAFIFGLLCLVCGLWVVDHGVKAERTVSGMACTKSAVYDTNTNGATQLVAPGGIIYICGYNIWSAGTVNVDLRYGTQVTNPCDTGATKITPAYQLTTQTGIPDSSPYFRGLTVPAARQLCINTSAGVAVQALVYYETGGGA